MFGIGGEELFLILLFGFLIFGPDKLPDMAKTLGKGISKFKSAQEEMSKVIKTEVYDPNSDEPFKNPLEALSKVGEVAKTDAKQESFSERKAKYDKERAAKKAAEASDSTAKKAAGAQPKPSADELYGTKPKAKKPDEAAGDATEADAPNEKGK